MNSKDHIKNIAVKTIRSECESVENLINFIDDDFVKVVNVICNSKGRVIVTGIGKSANIAGKIVATLNSTGTPAIFMHAADAIHGDLGIILEDDIVICISKSGNTPEIKALIPLIKKFGNPIIGLVSNLDSYLADNSDYLLKAPVDNEACPNNLAPTNSTTAQLVLGDALAVCLLEEKGFSTEDFAKIHPGGSLGKKLYAKVEDISIKYAKSPIVSIDDPIEKVIVEISAKRMGSAVILDKDDHVIGIITDGDLRRMLEKNHNLDNICAKDIYTKNPKTIDRNELAITAFNMMNKNNILQLIVTDNGKFDGMIHLHDILKEGII